MFEAVWICFKVDSADLEAACSMTDRHPFLRVVDSDRQSVVQDAINEAEDNWELKGVLTVEKVDMFYYHGKPWEVQRACKEGGEVKPTSFVKVFERAHDGIIARKKLQGWPSVARKAGKR